MNDDGSRANVLYASRPPINHHSLYTLFILVFSHSAGVLYSVIFCTILLRTPEVSLTQRRSAINSAIGNSLTVIPILVYQVRIRPPICWCCSQLTELLLTFPIPGSPQYRFFLRTNWMVI